MNKNKREMQEWAERLEQGERDDELLSLAARLEKAGADESSALPVEFQRQLRRDLLNQYPDAARPTRPVWRWAGALASVGLLASLVFTVWLSVSSAGRFSPGGAAVDVVPRVSTPPVTAAVLTAYSENMPEGLTPGGSLNVQMHWYIPNSFAGARPFTHLQDESGQVIAQVDGSLEAMGEEWATTLTLALPDALPPGEYTLVLGLLDENGSRVPLYDSISSAVIYEYVAETATIGGTADIAGESVAGPLATAAAPAGSRHTLLNYSLSGGIVAETMETDGGEDQTNSLLVPGIPVEVVMQWNSPADAQPATAFVHLLAGDGSLVAQADAPVPASDGTANETTVSLNLPDDLARGEYQLVGGLIDPVTGERLPISTAEGEVTLLPLGDYTVSAGGDAELAQMNEALIELQGSETVLELNLQDANRDQVLVREVTPASGAVLSGTAPIEFTITIDYALVSLPEANLDVKVTELMTGGSGRGVGNTVIPIEQGTGTTTVVVTVSPNELLKATELGLWIQIKPGDARSTPIFVDHPPDYRWSYTP